jgi:lactoylglutathione lyase
MAAKLSYAIKFVADMDKAVAFHRDCLGLTLKFQSPAWSEFSTGDTTLALHEASAGNPAGKVELGFAVDDLKTLYAARDSNRLDFVEAPRELHGTLLAKVRDSEGTTYSLSGPL